MLYLHIDKKERTQFIYQQIYEEIRNSILEGRMKPNEKLPSKRKLAEQLQVSVNSVMNAYDQLLAEGYIFPVERKGYYVENITMFLKGSDMEKRALPNDLKEDLNEREGWLSLSHMTSNLSLFPFKTWLKCQEKAMKHHKQEIAELMHPQGPYLVRKSISRLIALTRGVICEPEQIVIGAGTQLLIDQLMEVLQRNSAVAMEDPGYSRLYQSFRKSQIPVYPVAMDDQGIILDEVEASKANLTYVTPSHQFPTGKIMPISRRIELLNWSVSGKNRYILEDDYDSEFKYRTDNIPSLQSLDRNERVIYFGTFSKTMYPGLRISYMVLPPALLREYRKYYGNKIQTSSAVALFTMHYFIESGEYLKHIKRMNHYYETKRKQLVFELEQRFKENVFIEDVPAGLHFLAYFNSSASYEEIVERAKREKLELYTMERFMLKQRKKEKNRVGLVIGFSSIEEKDIPEAVHRIYRVLNGDGSHSS